MLPESKCEKLVRGARTVMLCTLSLLFPHPAKPKTIEFLSVRVNVVVSVNPKDRGANGFTRGNENPVAECDSLAYHLATNSN